MLKQIPIWFLLWLLPVACLAGSSTISTVVGKSRLPTVIESDEPEIRQHFEQEYVGYKVAVDFADLPQPLKTVHATVTVTYGEVPSDLTYDVPRGLNFGFYRQELDWVGEKSVVLGNEWQAGDVRTVPIEFTVLQSQGDLYITWDRPGRGFAITWCFDEKGMCIHLDTRSVDCGLARTFFFDSDSIKIPSFGRRDARGLLDWSCTVVPPFHVGDTSTVCFHLTALQSFPSGFDLEIGYGHMLLVGVPEAVKAPISPGQTLDLCMQVVPLALREQHAIELHIVCPEGTSGEGPQDVWMGISAYFRDDGSPMYVYKNLQDLPPEKLSKSLPAGTRETCGSIRIDRNPDVTEGSRHEGGR